MCIRDSLGYRLTTQGIQATDEKIDAIMKFPTPRNQKQLKGFLGLTNFYNRFTDKYAETTKPLLELLRKGHKFTWTPELNECFQQVKELFVETVILKFPRINQRYYMPVSYTHLDVYKRQVQHRDEPSFILIIYSSTKDISLQLILKIQFTLLSKRNS